jgi:hypothetical protein
VPTYQEAGIQGLVHDQWLGVLVPAAYMPDAAWAVSVHPPSLSRKMGQPPVLTSSNRISTLLQRFACARLSQSCLSKSRSDFSATFTTIAFDDSSLRWLEIST